MKFQIALLLPFFFAVLASGDETKKPEDVTKGEQLIQEVLKGIEAKNATHIGEVFEDDFVYKACKKKYSKEESIRMVSSFSIQMAKIMEKNTKIVSIGKRNFLAAVMNSDLVSQFVVSKNWKLQSGKTTEC